MNTTASAAGDILGGALVKNVENINVRVTAGTAATLDASSAAGLTNINANLGAGTLVATDLAKGAAVTVTGDGTVANGEVAFGYAATATDAVTLNVAGGTKMTAAITAKAAGLGGTATGTATTATINSTGAANVVGTVDLANATLTAVTINAATNLKGDLLSQATDQVGTDGVVTVKGAATVVEATAALDDTIKTIDASGLTAGGFKGILGTGITSFKGGAGADSITTAATTATGAVIDGGAGTDTLTLAATNDVTTAAKGAQYTNFEILGLNNTQDVSLIAGITALELNAMTSKTISKISATQAAAITVTGDQGTAVTLTLADATGTADAVSLNLKSATATNNVDVNGLSIVGVETLSVAATTGSAGDASAVSFANSGADKLTAINVSGAANSSFAGGNTAKAITLNSTATGNVTLTGNWVTGSSFTLGGGKDTITLGSGFNTYNSGAGDDTFNATAAQLNTGADYNVINGGEGTDTLNITGGGALNIVDNNLSKISGIEKIVVATTTTNAQSIQTGGWFDAAFKANGVDLTTVSTTGTIDIDMTSFSGAATLTTTSTTGNQTIQTGTTGGNDKITAVATTGNVTVSTGAGDDVVSVTTVGTAGGEGAITITTGAGNDTITIVNAAAGDSAMITAGAGADKITLGTDAAKVVIGNTDSGITVATADSITGFVSSTHTIALGFNGGATNATEAAAAVADFATALTNANAALAALKVANPASTELANFQWDATNGYLFNDTNADGTADQVIVLVGITGSTFAVADIVA